MKVDISISVVLQLCSRAFRKIALAFSPLIRSRLISSFCPPPSSFKQSSLIYNTNTYGRCVYERPGIDVQPCFFDPKHNGVYTKDGLLVSCSALTRCKAGNRYNVPDEIVVQQCSNSLQACIYGGILFGTHYGHFLTETMSRLWLLLDSNCVNQWGNIPILFRLAGQKQYSLKKVAPFVRSVFDALGIWDRILIPSQQVFVENMVIPHASTVNNRKTHVAYVEMMQAVGNRLLNICSGEKTWNARKIYLSRSKLPQHTRRLANERRLEEILTQNGYTVVHPQKMNFIEQIKMFREADEVVGPVGSAFHTLPLAGNSKLKVKYLVHYEPCGTTTYNNIDSAFGIESVAIHCIYTHPLNLKAGSSKDQIIDLDRAVKGIFETHV